MEIAQENTFRKYLTNGINLFVGAGFSVLAKNKDDNFVPLGNSLKEMLAQRFGKESLVGLDLAKLSTVIESENKAAFREFLDQQFEIESFDERLSTGQKPHTAA